MAYADNQHKVRGIEREPIIMEGAIHSLRKQGCSVKALESTLNENMRSKIDYKLDFGHTLYKGHFYIPVDIKSGWTFTLITTTGVNTLEKSKSHFLIYEFDKSDDYYAFISVPRLRELVKNFPPKLRASKFNSSKYFSITDYLFEHSEKFEVDEEYFEIQK